ncbi:MAG: hypothetical protein ACK4NY_15270 [Spirosomataceae bacterium]
MTTLVLEVNNEQKKALKGILKYLKVSFYEKKANNPDPKEFAEIIDYGIDKNAEDLSTPFSHIENSAEYVKNLRNIEWK